MTEALAASENVYGSKTQRYFAGARHDWVRELPSSTSARILEIGCGNGDTGAAVKAAGKCGFYAGVDIYEPAARQAARQLDDVLIGDIEHLDLPWPRESFDALLMSEVLEHLRNPAPTLQLLVQWLKPGAMIFASSPNVCHYSIIRMLLGGRWDLADQGAMDRTHLRWFTPRSYQQMFEQAGCTVQNVGPVAHPRWRGKLAIALTLGRGRHLFMRQINLVAVKN